MKNKTLLTVLGIAGLVIISHILIGGSPVEARSRRAHRTQEPQTSTQPTTQGFGENFILEETGDMSESANPNWWLNSGAWFYVENGIGKTVHGKIEEGSKWQAEYAADNPIDTDNGYHPQNLFRLVEKGVWKNPTQELYFKINRLNVSDSPERRQSNGVLFFSRYQDANNLYYSGVRVDGTATIKKKIGGVYYDLADEPLFAAEAKYDRDTNPNLVPGHIWIGIKSELQENPDGTVTIKLFVDKNESGNWTLAAEVTDNGESFGGDPIEGPAHAGIRTDFIDVELKNYSVKELAN